MKVDEQGILYNEATIDGVTGRMNAVSAEAAGAKIDPAGLLYKEEVIDGITGRMPVVSVEDEEEPIRHNDLEGRDAADAHPMSAITGLEPTIADINEEIGTIKGNWSFLPAYNFGTATPTQQQLTDYAESLNIEVKEGLAVVNTFDNHDWRYDAVNTQLWQDQGVTAINMAKNDGTAGIVAGSTNDLKVKVETDGTMSVNGLSDKLSNTTLQYVQGNNPDVYNIFEPAVVFSQKVSALTGCIKIKLPSLRDLSMNQVEIDIYEHNENLGNSKLIIGFQTRGEVEFRYPSLSIIGKYNKNVRIRYDSTDSRACILLGDIDTIWNYPTVSLNKITTNFTAVTNKECSISLITDETGLAGLAVPANYLNATHIQGKDASPLFNLAWNGVYNNSTRYYKVISGSKASPGGYINRIARVRIYDRFKGTADVTFRLYINASVFTPSVYVDTDFNPDTAWEIGYVETDTEFKFYIGLRADTGSKLIEESNFPQFWTRPATADEEVLTDISTLTMLTPVYNSIPTKVGKPLEIPLNYNSGVLTDALADLPYTSGSVGGGLANYLTNSSTANLPVTGSESFGTILGQDRYPTSGASGDGSWRLFVSKSGVVYSNTRGNGSWTGWRKIWNEGNFNPSNYVPITGTSMNLSTPFIVNPYTVKDYAEGIRINRANNNWAGIMLGAAPASSSGHDGTGWYIGRSPDGVFMINPIGAAINQGLDLYKNGDAKWRGYKLLDSNNFPIEKGTFNATLGGTTTNGVLTYAVQRCTYNRKGDEVTFRIFLQGKITTKPTGAMIIRGLPFTIVGYDTEICCEVAGMGWTSAGLKYVVNNGTPDTTLSLSKQTENVALSALNWNENSNTDFQIHFVINCKIAS